MILKKLPLTIFMSAIAVTGISVLVATVSMSQGSSGSNAARTEAGSSAEASTAVPTLERLDAALDLIVPAREKIEKVATGFTWAEGPIWIPSGYLMFADIPSNSIRRWTPGDGASIFMQPSGYRGSAPYGGPEPGSNGMTLDRAGRLTVAGHRNRMSGGWSESTRKLPLRSWQIPIKASA